MCYREIALIELKKQVIFQLRLLDWGLLDLVSDAFSQVT